MRKPCIRTYEITNKMKPKDVYAKDRDRLHI